MAKVTKASPFIFISYSREDQIYAEALARAFEKRDLSVWMDDSIQYGDPSWMRTIGSHLIRCDAFVLLMTPRALDSYWVQGELITALQEEEDISCSLRRRELVLRRCDSAR